MKVGILGSGSVGTTLANGFTKHGHEVMMGSRKGDGSDGWEGASGTLAEAATHGELLVLCVKGTAALEAMSAAGDVDGKIVIDATNPISGAPENGVLPYFTTMDESLMEQLQKAYPNVKFVKAFNSIGHAYMVDPKFEMTPTMFICGNDAQAKKTVSEILIDFGFEPEDLGTMEAARPIEALCQLWCLPGFLKNEWSHALRLMKK